VWFTDGANDRIGRLDRGSGKFSFLAVPTGQPLGMVRGHDGDLYFTERGFDKVGRLDPATGLFTEWTLTAGAFPNRLTVDPRGNVWFTELQTSLLGRIDPSGHLHETPLAGGPVGITYGNGYLFAVMFTTGRLDKVSLSGRVVRSWALPGAVGVLQVAVCGPIAWVTDGYADHVYRVDTTSRGSVSRS
jgi:virginiamycin B lyase